MANDLTIIDRETGEIAEPQSFQVTPVGMAVTGVPSITEWVVFGRQLWNIRSAVQWSIGDWIIYGESRMDWGEKYDQALAQFDYDYDYLANMVYIARRFPCSRRREQLSWSHHQTVAALPPGDQDTLLGEAIDRKLTREDLRDRVRAMKGSVNSKPPKPIRLAGLDNAPCKIVRVNHEARFAVIEFADTPAGYAALKALVALWRDEESGLLLTIAQHLAETEA